MALVQSATYHSASVSRGGRSFPATHDAERFTPLSKGADWPQASGGILVNRPQIYLPHFPKAYFERQAELLPCRQKGAGWHSRHPSDSRGAQDAQREKIPPLALARLIYVNEGPL